ncbi:MAG: hypothetical protein IKE22_04395 [Atopobiaceae bacterium]|nr:hypothetical protein [Atopobiaceae bacterium]
MAMSHEYGNRSQHVTTVVYRGSYLVEALFLLAILATAIAIFMSLFAAASRRGNESANLDGATRAACTVAERFEANPAAAQAEVLEDGYRVTCDVVPENTKAGTFYRASITVYSEAGEELYALSAARYVSEVS